MKVIHESTGRNYRRVNIATKQHVLITQNYLGNWLMIETVDKKWIMMEFVVFMQLEKLKREDHSVCESY